jgi:hypothetical protein
MSVSGMQAPPTQYPMPASMNAPQQLLQTGIELATALADFTTALVQNQQAAAVQVSDAQRQERGCAPGPAAASPMPAAPMPQAMQPGMYGGPLGGILQQVMQLLQMLTPLLMQMSGNNAPKANGTATNVANQMPGGRGTTVTSSAGGTTTTTTTKTTAGAGTAAMAGTAATTAQQRAADAAMAERYPVANVSIAGYKPATRETARDWVYTTLGTRNVSDLDMQNCMALYGIFTNGTPFR